MIYVLNREEQLQAVLDNGKPNACPYWDANVKEVLNGEYTFSFTVPHDHPDSEYLEELGYVAFQDYERKFQLFIITHIEEVHGEQYTKEVLCEHASLELFDDVIEELLLADDTTAQALPAILQGTKWEAGTIEATGIHDLTLRYVTVREALTKFANRWGVELSFRVELSGTGISRRYVDAVVQRGYNTGKRFEYRKDITEIRRELQADNVKTALYGYGKEVEQTVDGSPDGERIRMSFKDIGTYIGVPLDSYQGIARGGYFTGTFNINTNYAGVANAGEIRVNTTSGNQFYHPQNGKVYTIASGKEVGTAMEGTSAARTAYLVFVGSDPSRFTKPYSVHTDDFRACVYQNNAWYYDNNTSTLQPFTPNENDCIVAELVRNSSASSGIDSITLYNTIDLSTKVFKPKGQAWIGDDDARLTYGKVLANGVKGHRFGVEIFQDAEDAEELLEMTYDSLQKAKIPLVQYSCKVVDLARILGIEAEAVHMGDLTKIIDRDMNLRLQARVIEYSYDLTEPEGAEVVLGNFLPVLTNQMQDIRNAIVETVKATPLPTDIVRTGDITDVVRDGDISDVVRDGDITDVVRDGDITDVVRDADITDVLRQGSIIQTSWLEGAINAAQNQVLAGTGTVQVTENDGILIVDNPTNPQKAIKLLAGTIALANERDPVTGLFNWRTFGTAEGWLADLVETGFLKFDRSQGGILTLGGAITGYYQDGTPVYQNGILNVIDSSGDTVVTLTGDNKGFDKLFIGELSGNNVVLKNTKGDYTIYVDPVSGNDANNGLSTTTALRTVQSAIDRIPSYNNKGINIVVQGTGITWVENLNISGIMGAGRIGIYLGRKNVMKGYVLVDKCVNEIFIGTIVGGTTTTNATGTDRAQIQAQSSANGSAVVYSFCNTLCNLYDIILSGNSICPYGFNGYSGYTKLEYCEIYNCTAYAGLYQFGARGDVYNCAGSNPRGLRIAHATIVGGGGRGFYSEIAGGEKVTDQGAVCSVTWTYSAGAKTPTYNPVTVTTWTANDTQSLFGTNWGLSDYIYTGQRNSTEVAWYGWAFFNTANFGALKNADGTNRPIQKVRILVQRYNGYGENTARKPTVYWSSKTAPSGTAGTLNAGTASDVSFLWGDNKWITLPTSFGTAFQAGTAKSICFYNGNDLANYMRFEPSMTLEITHG